MNSSGIRNLERQQGLQFLDDVIARLADRTAVRLDSCLKQVLAGVAGAALNRLGAIREMVRKGAYPEGAILARTLIELQISAAYILWSDGDEPERKAQRFLAFELRQRNEQLERACQEYTDTNFPAQSADLATRAESIRSAFADACREFDTLEKSNSWAKSNYRQMIDSISDEGTRTELMFAYRQVYFAFSEFAHPTPTGIRHALAMASTDEHPPVLLPYAVPLFSGIAVTHMCNYARAESGATPHDISDLILPFVDAMPKCPV